MLDLLSILVSSTWFLVITYNVVDVKLNAFFRTTKFIFFSTIREYWKTRGKKNMNDIKGVDYPV